MTEFLRILILAFSRLGQKEVTRIDLVDMGELIRDVWQELVTIHPDRKMSLTIGQMPAASGDRTLLRQVYDNLLGNAVKFMMRLRREFGVTLLIFYKGEG